MRSQPMRGSPWRWRGPCRTGFALAVLLAAAGPATAVDALDIVLNGNANGAAACSACHGPNGEGNPEAGYPRLAGLSAAYLAHQLDAFASGARANDIMGPVAQALSPEEGQAVAALYARNGAAKAGGGEAPDAKLVTRGAALAATGDWSKGVPGCGQCHGPAGQGIGAAFPALAGQNATYLAAQIAAWKAGTRKNDPLGLMAGIAGKLGDDEVGAVSAYYASLPVPAPQKEGPR